MEELKFDIVAKNYLNNIPKHSGWSKNGLLDARSYLEKFLPEIDVHNQSGEFDSVKNEVQIGIKKLENRMKFVSSEKE